MRKLLLFIFLLFMTAAGGLWWYLAHPIRHPEAVVMITPGTPVAQIARQLTAAGVISAPDVFTGVAVVTGKARQLKAGEYVFPDGLAVLEVFDILLRGDVRLFRITLPEGWTMREIAAYLERRPFAAPGFAADVLAACQAPDLLALAGIGREGLDPTTTLEGYLFPDTYDIPRPASAREVVRRLVQTFRQRFTEAMKARAHTLGLSSHQVVTLASIIEKETGAADERPLISAVFHNRLKQGMALASDPTIIYGLPNFDGNLRKADLSNPHPYNTYVHVGLPPGPIANPGLAALDAALNPAAVDYLYFVSRNNGTHAFATTYAEHARNVEKYQIRRAKE